MSMTPVEAMVHRILVVEDDREQAESLKAILERQKYTVEIARDAGQAHVAYTMHLPDFVLLDLMLPKDVSGFEVCEKMKRENDSVPIVVLTAIDMDDAREFATRLGADGYITKPYDPDHLLREIKRIAEVVWRRKHFADKLGTAEKVRFSCTQCGKHLKVRASHRGRTLNCPKCGQSVVVPLHD
ncbi:MAG: response regulator [Planctomycetaceae bacterium]|nr:response regulator [Planctomycetaceae bacterium]MCA9043354.1 response regulator [Planctomycetaceae bacterium]MCB9950438.1 response regulator [Planctomycetaceae bacterium]